MVDGLASSRPNGPGRSNTLYLFSSSRFRLFPQANYAGVRLKASSCFESKFDSKWTDAFARGLVADLHVDTESGADDGISLAGLGSILL